MSCHRSQIFLVRDFQRGNACDVLEMLDTHSKKKDFENLPSDILTVLLVNEDDLNLPYDVLQREIAFYLLAGAQTSIHSLVHVFHEIHDWIKNNPKEKLKLKDDPIFVQKCFLESTRLHPSSPIALRKPVCPVKLPDDKDAESITAKPYPIMNREIIASYFISTVD